MSPLSPDQALGAYLRALRVQAGLDVAVLARRLSLSPAQLMQLESGQASLFYNHRIRQQAARRVIAHLGGDPSRVEDGSIAADAAVSPTTIPASPSEPVPEPAPVLKPARPARQTWGALALLVLLAMGGAWMARGSGSSEDGSLALAKGLALKSEPGPPAPQPATPSEPAPLMLAMADTQTPAEPVAALSGRSQVAAPQLEVSDACADAADQAPTVRPVEPRKAGDMVYVVSMGTVSVCLLDGSGKQQRKRLEAGQAHSFYGPPPWVVRSDQLRQTQLYFQGWKVHLPAQAQDSIKLVEAR